MSLADPSVNQTSAFLNIYDLDRRLTAVNTVTLTIGLGGFFHVGLEVYGREFCFCAGQVIRHAPRNSPPHIFRQSVDLGVVNFSASEVENVVNSLEAEYPPYELLSNNCIHFVASLAKNLGLKPLPRRFFLLTDSLGFVSAFALGRRRIRNQLRLRPRFASFAAYKKPPKFEFSLVLDRSHTLTYCVPEDEEFLIVEDGNPVHGNIIGVPRGYVGGGAKLSIASGNIFTLTDLKKNISISLQLSCPFLLNASVICTLRPMPLSLTS